MMEVALAGQLSANETIMRKSGPSGRSGKGPSRGRDKNTLPNRFFCLNLKCILSQRTVLVSPNH